MGALYNLKVVRPSKEDYTGRESGKSLVGYLGTDRPW